MNINALGVQQQVQTAVLAQAMQTGEAAMLQLLAQMQQTTEAITQTQAVLSAGHVDITV